MGSALVLFGHDLSGPTSARPTNVEIGQLYFDTTIGQELFYNGTSWQPATASALSSVVNTAITTAGAGTLTAAALVGRIITRTGPVAAYSDTTGTAAAIIAALPAGTVGESFEVQILNTVPYAQTILAGSGVTLSGEIIIPPNSFGRFLLTYTGAGAVSMYGLYTGSLTSGPLLVNTAITTAGAGTLTAAGIVGGVITRTGPTALWSDATDTAAAIIAALPNAEVGQSFYLHVINQTNFVQTITQGASVTLTGQSTIGPNSMGKFLVTVTGATTLAIVGLASTQTSCSVQIVFNANNNAWPVPAGAKYIDVVAQAGGGGGGSGAMNTATNAASGGGGGGGGGTSSQRFQASDLNAASVIVVGPGGQGGAAVAVTGAGTIGNNGANSSFTAINGTLLATFGGRGAAGSVAGNAAGGSAGAGTVQQGTAGGTANNASGATGGAGTASATLPGATGGGAGGSTSATLLANAGGAGGAQTLVNAGGAAGANAGSNAANGNPGVTGTAISLYAPGTGGGGGSSCNNGAGNTLVAGAGGPAVNGGGGGGGAAAVTTTLGSGAGGNGGNGFVLVTVYF